MGLINRIIGSPEARAELRDARRELADVSRGITEETDEYVTANDRVAAAEKGVRNSRRV